MRRILLAATALTLLAACGQGANETPPVGQTPAAEQAPAVTAPEAPAAAPAAAPAEATPAAAPAAAAPAEATNVLASLPAPYNSADYEAGRRVFAQCRSCHVVEAGAPNRVGPNLHGIFTRKIGEAAGFNYSPAVQAADFQWTPEQLDHWLANPREFLPGNRMAFAGVRDETQRRNVVAYLMVESAK